MGGECCSARPAGVGGACPLLSTASAGVSGACPLLSAACWRGRSLPSQVCTCGGPRPTACMLAGHGARRGRLPPVQAKPCCTALGCVSVLAAQVGELLRTLSERLGIQVWERMSDCVLASIHRNFDRDAAEPSGQLPQQDAGSGGALARLLHSCTRECACTACTAGLGPAPSLDSAPAQCLSSLALIGTGLVSYPVRSCCNYFGCHKPPCRRTGRWSPVCCMLACLVQRSRTAGPTAAASSWQACCSRATGWSRQGRARCGTPPRDGSAWRRPSGWVPGWGCLVTFLRVGAGLGVPPPRAASPQHACAPSPAHARPHGGCTRRLGAAPAAHLGAPPTPPSPRGLPPPQALQHMMEGCGAAFRPHLDDPLRQLIYRALGHPNRFIRCVPPLPTPTPLPPHPPTLDPPRCPPRPAVCRPPMHHISDATPDAPFASLGHGASHAA